MGHNMTSVMKWLHTHVMLNAQQVTELNNEENTCGTVAVNLNNK